MWPFSHAVQDTRPVASDQDGARDILSDNREAKRKRRWTRLLIVYLRCLALLSLVRSLIDWAQILGFLGTEDQFLLAPLPAQALLVLLAVLGSVAGVGLWLTSAWGAVLWLIVTLCEVLLPLTGAEGIRQPGPGEYTLVGLAALYILLTWLSARERER